MGSVKGYIAGALLVSFVLAGCFKPKEDPEVVLVPPKQMPGTALSTPPELLLGAEEGFADFTFLISEMVKNDVGTRLVVTATHDGKPIRLAVVLTGKWETQGADAPIELRSGEVAFQSVGEESDRFADAMAKGYGLNEKPHKMAKEVYSLALSLEGNPAKLDKEACKIKVFLGQEGSVDYAEAFCNVDLPNKRLTIAEKDNGYRKALWRCFTGLTKTEYRSSGKEPVRVFTTPMPKK